LADAGFQRRRLRWRRVRRDFIDVIDFQPSKWNEPTAQEFTVNLGVLVSSVYQACWQTEVPEFPADSDCTVRRRIGVLAESGDRAKSKDLWWKMSSPSDLETTGCEVLERLTAAGLPFFEGVRSMQSVRDCLLEATPPDMQLPQT
jgi:hypothetical protein